jgi:lipoate-protein ligase A
MNIRTLSDGKAAGAANMARDEELARELALGGIPPTVRIYGWDPPAVSIGYHQSGEEIDRAALARAGIDLVRRPTGGRAILHSDEVTYCAVLPLTLGPPRAIYAMVNEALLIGIREMGIEAQMGGSEPDLRRAYATAEGVPCFSFSVRSEIQAGGRKLVGSAQRRYGAVVLQHGSFLLGPAHRELARYVRPTGGVDGPSFSAGIAADLAVRTTDAATLLGREVAFPEAAAALAAGFERYFSRSSSSRDIPPPARMAGTFSPQELS